MHPWLLYTDVFRLPTYFTCLMIGMALGSGVLRREALRGGLDHREVILDLDNQDLVSSLEHFLSIRSGYQIDRPTSDFQSNLTLLAGLDR